MRWQRGFTMLEILIAIAVFSVLSMAAYQVLQGVMNSDKISQDHTQKLKQMQRAMLIIERDLTQMVARTVRNGAEPNSALLRAGKFVAESESDGIDFVRLGWSNPQGRLPRSNLVRVAYRIKENNLERLYFLYPDVISGQEPEVQILIKDVNNLTLRYWDNGWQEAWAIKDRLPAGIAMEFDFESYGIISRLFITPQGEAVKATNPEVPEDPTRKPGDDQPQGQEPVQDQDTEQDNSGPNGGPVNGSGGRGG